MNEGKQKKVFEAIEIAEGYVRAACWREESEPPYERGKACGDLAKVHEVLAEMQVEARAADRTVGPIPATGANMTRDQAEDMVWHLIDAAIGREGEPYELSVVARYEALYEDMVETLCGLPN
jgi:hypothetical protein